MFIRLGDTAPDLTVETTDGSIRLHRKSHSSAVPFSHSEDGTQATAVSNAKVATCVWGIRTNKPHLRAAAQTR